MEIRTAQKFKHQKFICLLGLSFMAVLILVSLIPNAQSQELNAQQPSPCCTPMNTPADITDRVEYCREMSAKIDSEIRKFTALIVEVNRSPRHSAP